MLFYFISVNGSLLGSNTYYCQRLDHFIGTTILDFHNRWVDEDKWSVRCLKENWWAPADFDTMAVSWNLPTLFGPSQAKKEIKETKGPRALKVTLVSAISKHQLCSGIRFKLNCCNCLRATAEEWRGGGWSNTTWDRCKRSCSWCLSVSSIPATFVTAWIIQLLFWFKIVVFQRFLLTMLLSKLNVFEFSSRTIH